MNEYQHFALIRDKNFDTECYDHQRYNPKPRTTCVTKKTKKSRPLYHRRWPTRQRRGRDEADRNAKEQHDREPKLTRTSEDNTTENRINHSHSPQVDPLPFVAKCSASYCFIMPARRPWHYDALDWYLRKRRPHAIIQTLASTTQPTDIIHKPRTQQMFIQSSGHIHSTDVHDKKCFSPPTHFFVGRVILLVKKKVPNNSKPLWCSLTDENNMTMCHVPWVVFVSLSCGVRVSV